MMKVRKVKIGIKDVETLLNEFGDAAASIEAGKKVKHERGVYFTNIQAFRKALTQKRLELLRAIKTEHPSSINHLARILQRDIKNVAADVRFLKQAGLIDTKKEASKEISPRVMYDKILLEIAV
jgi:predicted transcriptional regulator